MNQLHKGHFPGIRRVLKEISLRETHLVNMASLFLRMASWPDNLGTDACDHELFGKKDYILPL